MPKFAEKRKYLFERTNPVKPLSVNTSYNNNINWMQNLVKTSNQCSVRSSLQTNEITTEKKYEKCCPKDHISGFTTTDKNSILNYYKEISKNYNHANEYLKRHVIPVPIKRKTISQNTFRKPKSNSFEYFVEVNNERKKICKTAFLMLHQITKSGLEKKIQHKREETQDLRGKHESRWNQIPQEVVDDIIDFMDNLPARESHYSAKTNRSKKYLPSDLNISKLHKNFLSLFSEYDGVVSYDFFNKLIISRHLI